MKNDNFFTFTLFIIENLFIMLGRLFYGIFCIIGRILIGTILILSVLSFFTNPVLSILYWTGKQAVSFIPLQLGNWLFSAIWIILTIIGILTFSGCLYYYDKYVSEPPHDPLSGWPD